MSYTMRSPAGHEVTVYTDPEWLELTDQPRKALMWTKSRNALLMALWMHGPFVDHKSGLATRPLLTAMRTYGYAPGIGALSALILNPIIDPGIERETKGKRTYLVRLDALPESWAKHLPVTTEPDPVDEPAPEAVDDPVEPPVEPVEPPPVIVEPVAEAVELQVTQAVAAALLTQVLDIIAAGTPAESGEQIAALRNDLSLVQVRLAARLEENDRLRRALRGVQDELVAAHAERDGLRQRLRAAEYNLEKAMNGDNQRIIMSEVRREVDKFMRATPTQKGD